MNYYYFYYELLLLLSLFFLLCDPFHDPDPHFVIRSFADPDPDQ